MDSAPVTCGVESNTEVNELGCKACPLCGALLLPLAGQVRCTRCRFTLCTDCDGTCDEY